MRILIVEDNHINQIVLEAMLKKLNVETYTADQGMKALILLEELQDAGQAIDMIFMDCQMPIMNGFEATQRIRSSEQPYAKIPIIAVTGNASSDDEKRCLESGMDAYLSKPFKLDAIRNLLDSFNQ